MNMDRNRVLWRGGALIVGCSLWCAGEAAQASQHFATRSKTPLNLVLISIDTLRADELSCYGYFRQTSPVLDSLAKRGRIFTNAFATAAITPSSHMSIFTSQYPFEHGVGYDREGILPGVTHTLADVLQLHGYQTAAFVGNSRPDLWFGPKYGFANGFLRWEFPNTFWGPNVKIQQWLAARSRQHEPFFLFLHAWDVHEPHLVPPGFDGKKFDRSYQGPVPDVWDQFLMDIDTDRDGSSFAQQQPAMTAQEVEKRRTELTQQWRACFLGDSQVAQQQPAMTVQEAEKKLTELVQRWRAFFSADPQAVQHIRATYDAQLYYADQGIGSILEWLKQLQLDEHTLIVVTADHGQEFGEHHKIAEHAQLYDELLHVPLMIVGPSVPSGPPLTQFASSIDIMPTVLELLDIPIPYTVRGVSLVPLLHGESREVRKVVYATVYGDVAVRTQEWKWIRHPDGREELYDLLHDPKERRNVLDRHAAIASALASQFEGMLHAARPTPIAGEKALQEQLRKRGYW